MPSSRFRLPLLAVAAGAALTLSGCIVLPPAVPTLAPPPAPTETRAAPEPVETEDVEPTPDADSGDLPEYVDFGTELEPGTLAGWETSIIADDAFAVQDDSDFPVGPTIHVVETATGCTIWAYQGAQDSADTDEYASSEATLAALSGTTTDDWDPDTLDLSPSTQGVTVAFLSIYTEDEATGDVEAYFARNFQSSQSTSSIRATCGGTAGGIDHIDDLIAEHFQINFLVP